MTTGTPDPGAFDALAATYDQDFSDSRLGRLLRRRVWKVLDTCFPPGSNVLELASGTGEDALYLAARGVRVTALDGSKAMVRKAREKVQAASLGERIDVERHTLQEVSGGAWGKGRQFSGAFSNFGGLNTIARWHPLAKRLANMVESGGKVVLVPMGPYCPWELLWYAVHGEPRKALRRWRQPATASIGGAQIPIWYPSLRRLKAAFGPWFHHRETRSLGLWLPPSYAGHLLERFPRLFRYLARWEEATASLSRGWGDHYIAVFERR